MSNVRGARRTRYASVLALVFGVTLTGCGFQLQGRVPLSPTVAVVYIEADDSHSDFVQALRRGLRQAGARLAVSRQDAGAAVLRIDRDEFVERVASISSRNLPREYEVAYLVRYSLEREGVLRIEPEDLSASRDFSFDERLVLAKSREREQIRERLAGELAGLVLRRLASQR